MKTRNRLFQVTLLWNPNDSSEGDFSELVWAKNGPSAVMKLAKRMSFTNPELITARMRRRFEHNLIESALPFCAVDLHAELSTYLTALFKGPRQVLTIKRRMALQEIHKILESNGLSYRLDE